MRPFVVSDNGPKCWWCNKALARKTGIPGRYFVVVRDLDGNPLKVHKQCADAARRSFLPNDGLTAQEATRE